MEREVSQDQHGRDRKLVRINAVKNREIDGINILGNGGSSQDQHNWADEARQYQPLGIRSW